MKKFLLLTGIILGLCGSASANTDFVDLLKSKGIDTETLIQSNTVPRELVTEILNIVDCKDCHRPSEDTIGSLSQSWWNVFRLYPGKNFDDVAYNTSLDQSNNYYCIAYVANKGYMNGFPRSTSPVCSGKFCGDNYLTNADLIQTVFNITAPLFYGQYKADWTTISSRLSIQSDDIKRYFGLEDIAHIVAGKTACTKNDCEIKSADELKTYVKYCTYEPSACSMQEFPFAKIGKWPIAEMNILVQQGIFTSDDLQSLNIENYANGAFIIDLLGRVKLRSQCVDEDDQDHDGLKDYQDNCYLTYNPLQRDADHDKIGDVCDDDLDNDTIKNPIGIVDDNGNIVYDVIKNLSEPDRKKIDDCLFIVNTDQLDDDKNGVGNACDIAANDRIGISIIPKALTQDTFAFVAQYTGDLTNFVWYFGDRTTGNGETTSHTYKDQDQYTVRVEATAPNGDIVSATTTVTVKGPTVTLIPAKLVQNVGESVKYVVQFQGVSLADINYVEIQRGDDRTRQLQGTDITSFFDAYSTYGNFTIGGTVYLNNGNTLPLGSNITVVGQNFCMGNIAGSWGSKCDLDKDAIPDICDTDIDGDTVQNPLGIIHFEKQGCIYDATNVSVPVQASGNTATRDNCPFVVNPAQGPCKGLDLDKDGDGIPDSKDVCPLVPETFNSVQDTDGCPEYNVTVSFPPTKLQPGMCNICPCQYAQNDSAIAPGDRVKAVLYDNTTQKPVAESRWYIVP